MLAIITLSGNAGSGHIDGMGKRTEVFSGRADEETMELFRKAASVLWPGATLSTSGMIIDLARRASLDALRAKKGKPAKGGKAQRRRKN